MPHFSFISKFIKQQTLVLILVFVACTFKVVAQNRVYTHFEAEDEFQDCEIYHVMEDSRGKIWFSTDQGAIVYDGSKFERITSKEGLPDNTIFECFEDFKGRIWFASYSLQLSYYENGSVVVYKFNDLIQKRIIRSPLYDARSFFVDKDETVNVGSSRGFYISIDKKGTVSETLEQGKFKSGIFCIQKGDHYFGANNQFTKNDLIVRTDTSERFYPDFLSKYTIRTTRLSVAQYNGALFLARGPYIFSPEKNTEPILQLDTDIIFFNIINNRFLVSPMAQGLLQYELQNGVLKLVDSQFSGKSVSCYLEDSDGGIWITTLHDGVYYSPNKYIHSVNNTEGIKVKKLDYSKETDRITFINSQEETFTLLLDNPKPQKILEGTRLPVNVGEWYYSDSYTQMFAWKFDGLSKKTEYHFIANNTHPPVFLKSIDNRIYSISINRISEFDPISNSYRANFFFSKKSRIECLHVDGSSAYVGLRNGLFRIKNGKKTELSKTYPELKQRITAIENFGNDLIIGTRNNGVYILRNKKLIHLNSGNGLIGDLVLSIQKSDNYIWVLTPQGISRIHPKKLTCTNRTVFNDLLKVALNDFIVRENDLILATSNGLMILDQKIFDSPIFSRKIYFDKIKLGNKLVNNKKTAHSPYTLNAVQFKVNGAPIGNAQSLTYMYRLIQNGQIPGEWTYSEGQEINFPFLDPGDYTFEITIADAEYPYKSIKYHFTITPPFWKTAWFILLILGFILITIFFSVRKYLRIKMARLRRKQTLQNQVYKFKQLALSRQINPHFIFNSLNSIQSFIVKNDKVLSTDFLSKFGLLIRKMLDHCQNDLVTVKEELEIVSQYLELEQLRFHNNFSWTIKTPNHEIQAMRIPPAILQPIVENAIWHGLMPSAKKRKIVIDFKQEGETVVCRIMDNGIGREASAKLQSESTSLRTSKGNIITHERLEILNSYYKTKFKFEINDFEPKTEDDFATIVTLHLASI